LKEFVKNKLDWQDLSKLLNFSQYTVSISIKSESNFFRLV